MSKNSFYQLLNQSSEEHSAAITKLQEIYGQPSQAGFGSAVFCDRVASPADLGSAALKYYRYFLGTHWEEFGEAAWMTGWKQIYERSITTQPSILKELQNGSDPNFQRSVDVILTGISTPEAGQQALSAVYDDPEMANLVIYTLGDGEEMSGLLIAGQCSDGKAVFLVFLLD